MDNIRKVLPIRKYDLTKPLVVVFNIHLTHFNAFGTRHYDRLAKCLVSNAKLKNDKVLLLPNITNMEQSIESRGHSMSKSLNNLLGKVGAKSCHLVAHSFTGIDARAAISMYGAHN